MRAGRTILAAAAVLLGGLPAAAQATIAAVNAASASSTTATLTIAKPTSTASGQVMIAVVSGAGTTTISAPTGWVLIQDTISGSMRQLAYYKVAGASEPTSYGFTSSASRNASGGITTYSGVNATVPIDASAESLGASGSAVAPAVTTSSANDLVIVGVSTATATSWTANTGLTERYDKASSSTTVESADFAQATAGTTATKTQVPAINTGAWTSQTIALRDATAAGLSISPASTASFSANIDGGDQTPAYNIPITVLDTRTGASAGLGWNLTITSTTLTTGTASLATTATKVTGVTATCANGGICVSPTNSTTYPVTVPAGSTAPTAVKFASVAATTGEGAFSMPASMQVSVPQNSFAGSYSSTVTIAVVSGP